MKISDDLNMDKIPINRVVTKGDPMSPKLFALALEGVSKILDWGRKSVNINGKY